MNTKLVQYIFVIFFVSTPLFVSAKFFNPDFIISDHNYTDSGSMSRSAIQKFLENKKSGLAVIKVTIDGALKRVSDVFYEAAKKYKVSQKLLLVTAQKEQSAITTSNLTEDQKNKLMGYCIYPGAPCENKYLGIFSQVDAAAWQFRKYFDNPQNYGFKKGETKKTNDDKDVTPKNKATAGLYNYTPYQGGERGAKIDDAGWGGNFLFWQVWGGWFGDPTKNASASSDKILAGAGLGGGPQVRSFNGAGRPLTTSFFAFSEKFKGGIYVATGDVDGDKKSEIVVGAGWGGLPYVRVFDGYPKAQVKEFLAFDKNFKGGVRVAVGDVDGDGIKEIITGAGFDGTPKVRIFNANGKEKGRGFMAFNSKFSGGVYVASGDTDGDKKDEIIVGAGEGGGPQVKIFDKKGKLKNMFFAHSKKKRTGVRVAAIDTNRDGKSGILTGAGNGDEPWVRVFSRFGKKRADFYAFDEKFKGGVYLTSGDINADGADEIIAAAGLGGGPQVRIFSADGQKNHGNFFAFDKKFRGGVRVATIR